MAVRTKMRSAPFYGYGIHRKMRPQRLRAVSVVLGRERMAFMDASDLYTEDFAPFDGRVWLNTAHPGRLGETNTRIPRIYPWEPGTTNPYPVHAVYNEFGLPRRSQSTLLLCMFC